MRKRGFARSESVRLEQSEDPKFDFLEETEREKQGTVTTGWHSGCFARSESVHLEQSEDPKFDFLEESEREKMEQGTVKTG